MKKFLKHQGCFDQSCLLSDTVHEILHSFTAPFICYMCEILHDQCEYFKELDKEQGYIIDRQHTERGQL